MGTGSGEPQEPSSAVPADFKWETTRDLDISVGMPSVTGNTPQYAVIRVYCSPILSDGNIVAMGVVTPSRPVFETAVTIPAGIGNIYVQTTLPDGTVAVSMEPRRCADEGRSRDALTPDGRHDARRGRQFDARLPAARSEGRG